MESNAIQALQLGCNCRSFGLFQIGTPIWKPDGVNLALEWRFAQPHGIKLALERRFWWRAGAKLALERHFGYPDGAKLALDQRFGRLERKKTL